MNIIAGVILIVLAILIVCWGDKSIKTENDNIVQAVSMPGLNVKFVKWACGIIFFWFGIGLIFIGK